MTTIIRDAKVKKYNKERCKFVFGLLKLGELFAAFLLTFGIYGLGIFANSLVGTWLGNWMGFFEANVGIINIWSRGLLVLLISIIFIVISIGIIFLIYQIIKEFLVGNWNWAQKLTEKPEGKEERLKENEKLEKEYNDKLRKKYGFGKEDRVEYINKTGYNNQRLGEKGIILETNFPNGNSLKIEWDDGTTGNSDYIKATSFKNLGLKKKKDKDKVKKKRKVKKEK